MRFLIYIPNARGASALAHVGLAHMIPDAAEIEADPGPDGKRGVVLSWPTNEVPPLGYIPEQQEWIPAMSTDSLPSHRYWVGFIKDHPPRPHELAWNRRFEGSYIGLGDGNNWLIPAAGLLPQSMQMGSDHRPVWSVREEFKDYFDESAKWFPQLISIAMNAEAGVRIDFDVSVFDYLARGLGLNYRLTPEVVSHLKLLGTDNLITCLRASLDGLAIAEEVESKKKDS